MERTVLSAMGFSSTADWAELDAEKQPTAAATYWLGRDIVRGVFKPGDRLKIEQLVKFYNIGHSPIREAILVQTTSGLVTHERHKGHRVASVSMADYDDLVNTYRRIYKLALGMALEKGDDQWEENLLIQLHRSQKVPKVLPDGDPDARERWQLAHRKFHASLLLGCQSPLLLKILGDLGSRLERYVNLFADLESDRHRDTHTEHRQIVDAAIARDEAKTFELLNAYNEKSNLILASIKNSLPAQA